MAVEASYCRLCQASCGVMVDVTDNRVGTILGDPDNLLSEGYSCPKGRRVGDLMNGPERLTAAMRRLGSQHTPIPVDEAVSEIGDKITRIIADHGPDSVAMFMGTQHHFATLTDPFARAWFKATGSRKLFSTMTIDQSAKWVATKRIGEYLGGRQSFSSSDVWLLAGTNPLVSLNGGNGDGPIMHNPYAALRAARRRGLTLIVIDPRKTETSNRADLHLRPRPGTDAVVFAGLLNVILGEDLHDQAFCASYVDGIEQLRTAVAPVTPDFVETVSGIGRDELIVAARMFAAGPRGMVSTGTGICMGPHSNATEHLATALNVVCGRYLREGEVAGSTGVLGRPVPARAAVALPDRTWESGYHSRSGAGLLYGQLPSGTLCDEILTPGPDRVRALIVSGGNPMLALPDHARVRTAMQQLDLLVTIDSRLSETAELAHYVIAPTMMYERADNSVSMERFFSKPFAMQTKALVPAPGGVIEDWQFFYRLARDQGYELRVAGNQVNMHSEPRSEDLLAMMASKGRVDLADVAASAHGVIAPSDVSLVAPALPDETDNRLDILPHDVALELNTALADSGHSTEFPMSLIVQRMREVMNSLGTAVAGLPKYPRNPAQMNPGDLAALDLHTGSGITITSAHGSIDAVAQADPSIPPGVVAISHGWSGTRDGALGANVNELTTTSAQIQTINSMPMLTSVPVRVSGTGQFTEPVD